MPHKRSAPILAVIVLLAAIPTLSCHQAAVSASISDLKSYPLNYDGKIVRVSGWLTSEHLGVFVESENRQDAIRLRSPDVVATRLPVQRDYLFDKFWKMVETKIDDSGSRGIHVELDGLFRVLKKDGKPAEEFFVFGQWPEEIITLRIRKIINK
ncbi:MAG: hypothetical protein GXX81_01890 [Acidobacteria bacterium]|nr:hypothetical protein [Acidobacteriota bacterium]